MHLHLGPAGTHADVVSSRPPAAASSGIIELTCRERFVSCLVLLGKMPELFVVHPTRSMPRNKSAFVGWQTLCKP